METGERGKIRYLALVLFVLWLLSIVNIALAKSEAECLDILVKKVGTTDQRMVELMVFCGVKVMEGDKMYFNRDARAIEKLYPGTVLYKSGTFEVGVAEKRVINAILTKSTCDQVLIMEKAFLNKCQKETR